MKNFSAVLVAFLGLWLAGISVPVSLAQDQPVQDAPAEPAPETVEAEAADEPVEPTRADRLMYLKQVMELDQLKLAEIEQELEEGNRAVDALGNEAIAISQRLDEYRLRLEQPDPDTDAGQLAALTEQIASLELELELFKTHTELALTAESTLREQKLSMEENLRLQENVRAVLRGEVSGEPGQAPAAVLQVPVSTPAGTAVSPLPIPGYPTGPAAAEPVPIEMQLETPEQITALRELERLKIELAKAEQDVVTFVERKEALGDLAFLEDKLLQTAQGALENLEKALSLSHAKLERLNAADAPRQEIVELERRMGRIDRVMGEVAEEVDRRGDYLKSLNERQEEIARVELLVTRIVEEAREKVETAKQQLYWLQSPLHPRNLLQWLRIRGPRILLVILVCGGLLLILRFTARRTARLLVHGTRSERARGSNRADTLAFSFRSAANVLILVGGILLVFQEAGLDIKTVLGGAAILGVAIAFGAQNLMRDYFTGFLILMEDQYELGDLISIGAITGTVESVNMRITVLRDLEGRVHFIPNGEIKAVTNRTYGWGRAVLEVPIDYRENVDRAMEVLHEVSEQLSSDPEFGDWIEEEPVMLGVDKFTEYGVVIKFMLKTRPDKMFPVRRELLRRVKNRFDEAGIRISVPHRVVIQQKPED